MEEKCQECGEKATRTTEKIWTSYKITENDEYIKNDEIDDETIEVHFWCEKCFDESENWDYK